MQKTKLTIFLAIISITLFGGTRTSLAVESICPGGSNPDPNIIKCADFENPFLHTFTDWEDYGFSIGRYCSPFTGSDPATDCEGQSSVDKYLGEYSLKYTVEANENDGGWPAFKFPAQSASNWLHVRWYQKFEVGYVFGAQQKGFYLTNSTATSTAFKFQIRHFKNIPAYDGDSHWHYGFHEYYPSEIFESATNAGVEEYPDNLVGQWICYEVAVQPSTRSLKYWLNGDIKMDLTSSNFVGSATTQPSRLKITDYWGYDASGYRSPKTQSFYIDNLVISKEYIGCVMPTYDTTAPSAPQGLVVN